MMDTAIKHLCARPGSAVICNSWHLGTLMLRAKRQCADVKNYKWRLNSVWHRMLYSCIHMATVGVKWHICYLNTIIRYDICHSPTSSLQIVFKWHISTIRLYGAIYLSSCWKIQDRKQIKNTDNTHPGKTNSKHSKTKLLSFSRLLWHSTRKRHVLILQCYGILNVNIWSITLQNWYQQTSSPLTDNWIRHWFQSLYC